jgi:transposase
MRQRIQLSNTIRGHMAEYGLVAPISRNGLAQLIVIVCNYDDARLPRAANATGRDNPIVSGLA